MNKRISYFFAFRPLFGWKQIALQGFAEKRCSHNSNQRNHHNYIKINNGKLHPKNQSRYLFFMMGKNKSVGAFNGFAIINYNVSFSIGFLW